MRFIYFIIFIRILLTKFVQNREMSVSKQFDSLKRAHTANETPRLTLITTYWIIEKKIKHRDEIEMAMLSNLHNKYISEVVILLDNSTAQDCSTLDRTLKAKGMKLNKQRRAKFTCVHNRRRQSGYYDLFNYSKRVDSIVILSNADQVFDDSIDIARRLRHGHMIVLATRGFSSQTPENLKEYYPNLPKHISDCCYRNAPRYSWDSYVFRPHEISNAIRPEYFKVLAWRDRVTRKRNGMPANETLFMNVLGAENRALGVIKKYAPTIEIFQGCDFIRSWHLHQYKKTHYKKSWPILKTGTYTAPDVTNKTFRSVFYPVHSE